MTAKTKDVLSDGILPDHHLPKTKKFPCRLVATKVLYDHGARLPTFEMPSLREVHQSPRLDLSAIGSSRTQHPPPSLISSTTVSFPRKKSRRSRNRSAIGARRGWFLRLFRVVSEHRPRHPVEIPLRARFKAMHTGHSSQYAGWFSLVTVPVIH